MSSLSPVRSYRPMVIADDSGEWAGNALRFATHAEADAYAKDLASRWTLVRDTCVMESSQLPTHQIVDGVLSSIS